MRSLTSKYLNKLKDSKLAYDAVYIFNDGESGFDGSINPDGALIDTMRELKTPLLFFGRPAEPFFSALNSVAEHGDFSPNDSETRTFLHTVPVTDSLNPQTLAWLLKKRKAVYVKGRGIVTSAPYGAEQAYIYFCSVCFSGFVKFFSDAGEKALLKQPYDRELVSRLISQYTEFMPKIQQPELMTDIMTSDEAVTAAMAQTGKATVDMGLVDSFFGNISCLYNDRIFISRTGSSLDELEHETDICPVDESSCQGLTASSELATHKKIYELTDSRVILHAHPRFSVIMSMMCAEECANRGRCHYACDRERFLGDVPIVPGEVGNGKRAMVNTVPAAIEKHGSAIVYGHGVFTVSAVDFNDAFRKLVETETRALRLYHHLTCQPDADQIAFFDSF
ncbi:MAG: class II aldolase/adducin family protein [Deferribacterales bacterium]